MSEYIVSARKYRPMTFDSVVGQSALVTTLKNAVASGKLAHAYLFCGPRGVGKTTCARIFAKVINCMSPTASGDACGECESCKAFNEQRSLNIFELDAASNNGVEHIKALMEQTHIPPQIGKYKVFIIDEVHMLSTQAFNAFLKTLEEPPAHVVFILATTEKHKILPTIISRCQIYDFERMRVQDIVGHLKKVADNEGITYEEEALAVIAEKADGGMRDALSIFDQAASFSQNNLTYEKVIADLNVLDAENYFKMVDLSLENKVSDIMVIINSLLAHGFDGGQMVNGLASHIRNVMMAVAPQTVELIETSDSQRKRYAEQAKRCPQKFLYGALKLLNQCDLSYRQSSNKRLLVELTLIQVAQLTQDEADDPGAGRRPCKRLKSLFKNILRSAASSLQAAELSHPQRVAAQVATEGSSQQSEGIVKETPVSYNGAGNQSVATGDKINEEKRPTATKLPRLKLSSIGTSFHSIMNDSATAEKKEEKLTLGEAANENKPFTDDDIRREWLSMCNRMAQNRTYLALAKRMMNVLLRITELPKVDVICENTVLLQDIEAILPRIQVTMAQRLHNGGVALSLRLARQKEIVHRLSPQEFTTKLQEISPAFAAMKKELQLEVEL